MPGPETGGQSLRRDEDSSQHFEVTVHRTPLNDTAASSINKYKRGGACTSLPGKQAAKRGCARGGRVGWQHWCVVVVSRMAPRIDRSGISQRSRRTRPRPRAGWSWTGHDILCSVSEVLRRFGLLQRNAGVTTGSDHVGAGRQIHGRPPEVSFLSLFLNKQQLGAAGPWLGSNCHCLGTVSWQRAAVPVEDEGGCSRPAHPCPPARPALCSPGPRVPVSFPRRLDGASPARISSDGGDRILMAETGRQDREMYQIVPKGGESLFAFREGVPYSRRRLHTVRRDAERWLLSAGVRFLVLRERP